MENESSSGRGNGNVCSGIGYHGNLQSQGQSLLIPSTFNLGDPDPCVPSPFSPPPSSMQAMKKVQLLTCLPSPPRPKKEITGEAVPRSRAQKFSQQTVASDCKGCASNIQMTACTLMDPVQVQAARKRGRGAAVFSLFDGEHGRNAVVQCTQVIIEWLDKSGANGTNIVARLQSLFQIA